MKQNKVRKPLRQSREARAQLGSRFKFMCLDAGLNIEETAKLLHVTTRTVRYWFSGKSSVPYAAYRLVRVARWYELPVKGWEGWVMHSGKLWTPEGYGFGPQDSSWWSLLVRQAECFRKLYARSADFERALMALGAEGLRGAEREAPASLMAAAAVAGATAPVRPEGPEPRFISRTHWHKGPQKSPATEEKVSYKFRPAKSADANKMVSA